jgi:uncharacterized small protein (DUF1192 family)
MDTDELEPRRAKPAPRDLDAMSVAELQAYIGELQGEIDRAQAKIAAKEAHRAAAASALFKKR